MEITDSLADSKPPRPLRLGCDVTLNAAGGDRPRRSCAALIALMMLAPACGAQQATVLDPVVVSGTRFEQSEVTVPAAIEVVSRAQIEASGARNLADVLRGRGAVQVQDLFGDGSRSTVDIRGFGETAHGNTLILVDGRRLNNTDIAPPDLASISLKDIERIEIVRGSAGVLFGDQAVGGVVNILTRRPSALRAEARLSAGDLGRRGAEFSLSQRLDNGFAYALSGEKRESDNYRDNNAVTYNNVLARIGFEHSGGSVFGELSHVNENLRLPGALLRDEVAADPRQAAPGFESDYSNTDTTAERVGVRQSLLGGLVLEAELTNRESESHFVQSFRGFMPGPTPNAQQRHVVELTPRLVGAWSTRNGDLLLTAGYDLAWSDYDLQSILGAQRNEQRVSGLYLQAVLPIRPALALTLGGRYAEVENDLRDDFTFPSGVEIDDEVLLTEVGLSYRPNRAWRLFARRDENVRFAKVDEFTDPVPGNILRTQTGVSWEAGAEWADGRHSASLLIYRLDLRNEITTVPGVGAFGLPANTNLDPTRRDGLVAGLGWQASNDLHLAADYSFVDARVRDGPLSGKRVPFVARHSLRLGAEYAPPQLRGLSLLGELIAVDDRVFAGDFDNQLPKFPGYGVINAAAHYRVRGWTVGLRVNNLLDKRYSDFGARRTIFPPPLFTATEVESFFPAPERNVWITLGYRYDL